MQEQSSQAQEDVNQRFPSFHDYCTNDQMCLNGLPYQQLLLRFNQLNQSLNITNTTCTRLQNDLFTVKEELIEV